MIKLNSCPFCGSEIAIMQSKTSLFGYNGLDERIEIHRFYVRCGKCYARGGIVSGRVASHQTRLLRAGVDLPEGETTDNRLKILAAEAWNRRANV
jgi:hypothetical protein